MLFFSDLQNFTDNGTFMLKNLNFRVFLGTLPVTDLSASPDSSRANLIVASDRRRTKGISSYWGVFFIRLTVLEIEAFKVTEFRENQLFCCWAAAATASVLLAPDENCTVARC